MATGPGVGGPTSSFVPSFDSSGRLIIGFSRNPSTFPLMKWAQLVESPKNVGLYLKLSPMEASRVASMNDFRWARGTPRPMHPEGMEQFAYKEFRTERFDYGFSVDDDTDKQADWNIIEAHAQMHAAKAMTARTIRAHGVLTTAANWQTAADGDLSSDHTSTATALAGGFLDQGTSTVPYIKIALDKMAILINLDTIGFVTSAMLHCIINPHMARLWSESSEVHEYIKSSPDALDEIKMGQSPNGRYGLPAKMYGYPIIVDDTVKTTSRKGATLARSYAFPDQTVAMVARPGELTAPYSQGPNFSTLTIFWYRDEMTVERFHEAKHRFTDCHIVEETSEVLTAPASGFLLSSASSVSGA